MFGRSAPKLSGPRVPPLRGEAQQLVVLVHGYGADGNDLIALAPHWQQLLPHAAFVAPNAPQRCPGSPGYQWFPISRLDPQEMARGVAEAAPLLEAFLVAELERYNLPGARLALVGFSQGTMLSLAVGLARKEPPAAVVGFSGVLAGAVPQGADVAVLLSHGEADPMIPAEAMFLSATSLAEAGLCVQWHLTPALGHGIGEDGMTLAGRFLQLGFAGKLAAGAGPHSSPLR